MSRVKRFIKSVSLSGFKFGCCRISSRNLLQRPFTESRSKSFASKTGGCSKFLFLGSDDFSIKSLEAVIESVYPSPSVTICVVVSHENNLLGKYVRRLFLTGNQLENPSMELVRWEDFKNESRLVEKQSSNAFHYDLGVVASFGHLIPSRIIRNCEMGILNVHGSLLPRWRGAAPSAAAILSGEDTTGVSIMKIAPHRFDIGPILYQKSVQIDPHIRTPELTSVLGTVGAAALKEVLQNLAKYNQVALPQNESNATNAPKLTVEMSYVHWEEMNALEVYNLFRALSGRYKLKTNYHGKLVELDELSIYSNESDDKSEYASYYNYPVIVTLHSEQFPEKNIKPGQILYRQNLLCIKCMPSSTENDIKRNWIFVRKVKINQKWMNATDFKNGWLSKHRVESHLFESILSIKGTQNLLANKKEVKT